MISEGVRAVRKAVASVIAFVAYGFETPARYFARLAGRVSPTPLTVQMPRAQRRRGDPATKYTVYRWQDKRHWTAYEGPDGGEARRQYEAVEKAGETGRMEFQMTTHDAYVVRAVYENGEW